MMLSQYNGMAWHDLSKKVAPGNAYTRSWYKHIDINKQMLQEAVKDNFSYIAHVWYFK